jgi:hypothetical protein
MRRMMFENTEDNLIQKNESIHSQDIVATPTIKIKSIKQKNIMLRDKRL